MSPGDLSAAVELAKCEPYPYRALVTIIRETVESQDSVDGTWTKKGYCPINVAVRLADEALAMLPADEVMLMFQRQLT